MATAYSSLIFYKIDNYKIEWDSFSDVENKGRIYIETKGNIYIEKEEEKTTNSVIIEIRNEKVEEGYEERVSSEYFAACGTLGLVTK